MPDPDGLAPHKYAAIGPNLAQPTKPGWLPNAETLNFLKAVEDGFVSHTLEGFATFTYWWTRSTPVKLAAGQFEFAAWMSKLAGVPYLAAWRQAASNAAGWKVDAATWQDAIDRVYGQTGGAVWVAPVRTAMPRVFQPFLHIVYKDAEFIQGVGMRVPPMSLAWRKITMEMQPSSPNNVLNFWHETGPWVPWKGGAIGKTGEGWIQAWNINSIPNADMELARWDMDGLKAAIASAGSTPPPIDWTAIKHSGQGLVTAPPAAGPAPPPPPPPTHVDTYIPPGMPVTTRTDGSLVPLVVHGAPNDPIVVDDSGHQTVNPADGFGAMGKGLGAVVLGLGAWFLWSRRH